jgi:hypothetical protein
MNASETVKVEIKVELKVGLTVDRGELFVNKAFAFSAFPVLITTPSSWLFPFKKTSFYGIGSASKKLFL